MNAKKEFINEIGTKNIKCAVVAYDPSDDHGFVSGKGEVNSAAVNAALNNPKYKRPIAVLKEGYTEEDFNIFLEALDFEYDDGYGGQELFGVVFMKDGSWWTRAEYGGSEWWTCNTVPAVPDCCR